MNTSHSSHTSQWYTKQRRFRQTNNLVTAIDSSLEILSLHLLWYLFRIHHLSTKFRERLKFTVEQPQKKSKKHQRPSELPHNHRPIETRRRKSERIKTSCLWKGTLQICVESAKGRERIKKLFIVNKLFFCPLRAKERITCLALSKRFMKDTKKNSMQWG